MIIRYFSALLLPYKCYKLVLTQENIIGKGNHNTAFELLQHLFKEKVIQLSCQEIKIAPLHLKGKYFISILFISYIRFKKRKKIVYYIFKMVQQFFIFIYFPRGCHFGDKHFLSYCLCIHSNRVCALWVSFNK